MLDDAFRLTIDKVFETVYSPEVIDENGNGMCSYIYSFHCSKFFVCF